MSAPPNEAIAAAMDTARRCMCQKSQRGAAIWMPVANDHRVGQSLRGMHVISVGHNGLVAGECTGSVDCRRTCAKRCEHAEAAALRQTRGDWPRPLELLHVKAVDGELVPSGQPSCWQCSRAIVADGRIAGVWLFHGDDGSGAPNIYDANGWRRYTADEFHRRTLEGLGLVDRGQP